MIFRHIIVICGIISVAGLLACKGTSTLSSNSNDVSVMVEQLFPGLPFQGLTNLAQPDDGSGSMFVTEQQGVIHSFSPDHMPVVSHIFLDIRDRVSHQGNEEGLLGLAFDPEYKVNRYFYVYYSAANPRRSVISRFSVDPTSPAVAILESELQIMEISQPFSNHNGGQLAFGLDGNLYIGLGDGGGEGDPQGNGQNLGTLLGKILRIDVKGLSAASHYQIPADNPFISAPGTRPEIWAYGLRNPWRFSFDRNTGVLWCGDVGQNKWEEIDIISKGSNYGWNIMEGLHCYSTDSGCNEAGLTRPIFEYDHSQGCSITGGYVYRGDKIPALRGHYVYGDYCSGKIWDLQYQGNNVIKIRLLAETGFSITSFGEDVQGNLYILTHDGRIYSLVQKN
jgi:glucose/arabinose dehydrogenase